MKVLSVHEDSNSSLALLSDSDVLFAAAEERFTRNKFQHGFPNRCLEHVRRTFGIGLDEADVVVAGNPHHFLARLPGLLPDGEHDFFGPVHRAYLSFQHAIPASRVLQAATRAVSSTAFRARYGRKVRFVDHHTAHAYSAYSTAGFPQAVAVSADNMGDGYAAKVFDCTGGRCRELYGSRAIRSPGQFYGEITQLLGFHCLMAGKVTGLAAYGDWRPAYPVVSRLFSLSRDGTDFDVFPMWKRRRNRGLIAELSRFSPAEVAAATQKRFEEVMVGYVRHALQATGRRRLVLAGGIFGNVKLNQRLQELAEVDELFVHPAMSDQGIAFGAAKALLAQDTSTPPQPAAIEHVFFGPDYSEEEMGKALEEGKLQYTRPGDLERCIVDELLQGRTVARFHGAMEYGPRALGHRTILHRPDDPTVNDWLNRKLMRSEFMPFAPVTLEEHAEDCYAGVDKARLSARFMTVCFDCTDGMRKTAPGVVHVDGTARPQLIREKLDPGYYRIVRLFQEETGIPTLINTSFNMHGEPIVCSPQDAVRAFVAGRLDRLALGPFWVENR